MIITAEIVYEDISNDRLDLKLEVKNEDNSLSWVPIDIYNLANDYSGTILIFNDLIGVYERFDSIESAIATYESHKQRLQYPKVINPEPVTSNLPEEFINTNTIGVTVCNQATQSPSLVTYLPNSYI